MPEEFDFFGALGEVANGVGATAQAAADAAGAGIGAAAGAMGAGALAVAGAAGAVASSVGDAISGVVNPKPEEGKAKPRLNPKYLETVQRPPLFFAPKTITVHCVTSDPDGKPTEGRRQALKLTKRGVYLLASDDACAAAVERISISNCCVFKDGTEPGMNPIIAALGIIQGCLTCPEVSPVLGLIAFICGTKDQDKWYLYVLEHDGTERLFRINSRAAGDELLEFLDTFMLPAAD